jgi:DDE superfamily endonuclease
MAPRGRLVVFDADRSVAGEDAMPPLMLPETFAPLAAAFVPCFTAPTYRLFCHVVAGWVHCAGRHTVTGVALAAGVVGERGWRHVSAFHRFFSRAAWCLDHLGLMVFRLALRWVPAGESLVVVVDDTLARKRGKAIALGSMHHDPLLSSVRKAFASFGHVWVVLALWVPLPFGARGDPKGIALPLLFRLYVGSKRGNRKDAASARAGGRRGTSGPRYRRAAAAFPPAARRPTKPGLAREEIALVARWAAAFAPDRTVYVAGDTAYTNQTTMERRPANVEVVGRLRLDAALFGPPPPRRPGQRGRPRTRGERLPTPQAMAATRTAHGTWHRLRLVLYGKTVAPLVFRGTALWYGALREEPVRFVVVRDPRGRRRDEAFFCTDLSASARFVLETFAKRWTLEVTFFDCKQSLGFEDPQNQTAHAVQRTAPFAALVYALVALWGAHEVAAGRAPRWVSRPWYRHKASLAFTDLLAAFRLASTCPTGRMTSAAAPLPAPPGPPRRPRKSPRCARVSGSAVTRHP